MSGIGTVELVFLLLLLFIVVFGLLARKLGTPYPIVMVIGGLLLGFIPGIPGITLNPDLIFLVVLPPLLYAAAWTTSWRDFRYNLVSIFFSLLGWLDLPFSASLWWHPGSFQASTGVSVSCSEPWSLRLTQSPPPRLRDVLAYRAGS